MIRLQPGLLKPTLDKDLNYCSYFEFKLNNKLTLNLNLKQLIPNSDLPLNPNILHSPSTCTAIQLIF